MSLIGYVNLTFLGTRSKVLMLVHISPRDEDVGETICSLSFTKRARAIESNRGLTEVSTCTAVFAFICPFRSTDC